MIRSLDDIEEFQRRRALAWERNVDAWLRGPLRHVDNVGQYIVERVTVLGNQTERRRPLIVDMGLGSAWLLKALVDKGLQCSYLGLDAVEAFVSRAAKTYQNLGEARFMLADLEVELDLDVRADVIVNAFNFFELSALRTAMGNASRHLKPTGTLLMSTIDKTYLILALSKDWDEFTENLRLYQELPGVKYGFQHIDMGSYVSGTLEYPSVLYSAQDYIEAAKVNGMHLVKYTEHVFTASFVPKIYLHLEFQLDEPAAI